VRWFHFWVKSAEVRINYYFGSDLDYHLDNEKRGEDVLYYEHLRRGWCGGVVFGFFNFLYRIMLAASRSLNISFLRTCKPLQAVQ